LNLFSAKKFGNRNSYSGTFIRKQNIIWLTDEMNPGFYDDENNIRSNKIMFALTPGRLCL
jgi:hypothetical protein